MDVLHAMGLRGLGQDFTSLFDSSLADPGATAVDSGGQTVDTQGNVIDNINGTLTTPDGTVYDSYGNIIDNTAGTLTTPAGTVYNAQGEIVLPDGTRVDQANNTIITPDGVTHTNQITLPLGLTSAQIQQAAVRIAAQTGTPVGQWLARTIGGNTVLYRNPQGGIGTFNVSSMLLPAAILLGIFFLGKRN